MTEPPQATAPGVPSFLPSDPGPRSHLSQIRAKARGHRTALQTARPLKQKTHFYEDALWVSLLRYYFKKASDEFACGAVFEEIWDDETVLPTYEGRILGKVERID